LPILRRFFTRLQPAKLLMNSWAIILGFYNASFMSKKGGAVPDTQPLFCYLFICAYLDSQANWLEPARLIIYGVYIEHIAEKQKGRRNDNLSPHNIE
jgi:hypothetical protein